MHVLYRTEDGAAVTLGAHSHNRAYIGRAKGWASYTSLAPDRIAHRRGGAQLRSSLDFHTPPVWRALREQMRKPVVTVCALDEGVRAALHPHRGVQAGPEPF